MAASTWGCVKTRANAWTGGLQPDRCSMNGRCHCCLSWDWGLRNLFLPSFFLFDFSASVILESWFPGHLLRLWHLRLHPYLSAYWKAVSVMAGTALLWGHFWLCDLRRLTPLLLASISSSVKWCGDRAWFHRAGNLVRSGVSLCSDPLGAWREWHNGQ